MRTLLALGLWLGGWCRVWAADPLDQAFQNAILAEETRRDLGAAIRGYEEVVARIEAQRSLAATAVFRLGECYRKVGRTNDAVAQYRRLMRDYPGEETLVRLSRQNLVGLGVGTNPEAPGGGTNSVVAGGALVDEETQEIARLQTLLRQSPDLLNGPPDDRSPLYDAAEKGRLRVVQTLLGWNADVNRKSGAETPLHAAAGSGHRAVVAALLDAKADPDVPGLEGRTAFSLAAGQGYLAVVQEFLRRGVRPGDDPDQLALYAAVAGGRTNVIEVLVQAGAQVNGVRGSEGAGRPYRARTPLEEAVIRRQRGSMHTLIRLGAVVVQGGEQGRHPLEWALFSINPLPDAEWIQALLSAAPPGGYPEAWLDGLLRKCVDMGGRQAYLPLLLRAGASVDPRSTNSETPLLCLAASKPFSPALEILLEAKPNPNVTNAEGTTALHVAADEGDTNHVRLLLRSGADPNRLDAQDRTPLSIVRMGLREVEWASGHGAVPAGASYRIRPSHVRQALPRIEAMLVEAGATEDGVRRLGVHARRGSQAVRLARRNGEEAPPTLADALAISLGFAMFSWPQLEQVRVLRPVAAGNVVTDQVIVPKAEWWNDKDGCEWNLPLQWGDVLEIPEQDHRTGEAWRGLSDGARAALIRCTSRPVTLRLRERTYRLSLKPTTLAEPGSIQVHVRFEGSAADAPTEPIGVNSCWFSGVMRDGGVSSLFRTSSDLTRVRVTRAAVGRSWTFDATRPADGRSNELWLLDGDVIEIPEKAP